MSDGDVSLIRDEDLLRRMWQQTEDFSRKKEIRTHMYRLREERLRNLYSPEPSGDGKGCEFPAQDHVKSFADQSFQSMKSKEVRDAGSPPKEFTYRGQDLKALSNAGWNVEQENRTTDDGHTHVKSVNANIEGKYDVEGGKGQFAAVDQHKEAITEYQDNNSSLKRNETSSNTAAREHVVRQTDDGTHILSTTSSSTATSKFQQVSSSRHDTVPNITNDDYNLRNYDYDTNRNEEVTITQKTKTEDYEHNLKNDYNRGDIVSRKVEYPDDNTKVIVETRRLPDGTRITSTRREFRAPVQTHSEHHQVRENQSYSTQERSDSKKSSTVTKHLINNNATDIVDSQRHVDEYDFKRQIADYTITENNDYDIQHDKKVRRVIDHNKTDDDFSQRNRYETKINKVIESTDNDEHVQVTHRNQQLYFDDREVIAKRDDTKTNNQQSDDREIIIQHYNRTPQQKDYKETQRQNTEQKIQNIKTDKMVQEIVEKKTTTDYQTTYNTDYNQKKISNDWSPSHQAWASTLRTDTPSTTRPSTRASSPGSRTFKSSTSSLRSSVSPDKTNKKPSSRGGSPNKVDRSSPARTHSTHSVTEVKPHKNTSSAARRPPSGRSPTSPGYSPERKPQDHSQRSSVSPEKKHQDYIHKPNASPDRKFKKTSPTDSPKTRSPTRQSIEHRQTPTGKRASPERKQDYQSTNRNDSLHLRNTSPNRSKSSPEKTYTNSYPKRSYPARPSQSPDKKPEAQKVSDSRPSPTSDFPRATSPSYLHQPTDEKKRPHTSPDRKPGYDLSTPGAVNPSEKYPAAVTLDRSSVSPDRKPGYMKPTVGNKPTDDLNSPSKPSAGLNEDSFFKQTPKPSADRNSQSNNKTTTKIQEDHYKLIDEETKMYTRTKKQDTKTKETPNNKAHPTLYDQNYSSKNKDSNEDTPDLRDCMPTQRDRSPSSKDNLNLQDVTDVKKNDIKIQQNDYTQRVTNKHKIITDKDSSNNKTIQREQSPPKYGTYDKKQAFDGIKDLPPKDVENNSLTGREKSPTKTPSQPSSPTKKTPRDSVSPVKTYNKDIKFKNTTEFIKTEITTEEINKKTTKDKPRQLVTPSSSPTRKPKTTDADPSTGQSSPTTSVSGFVYIRPESLAVKRSPSPSKIPSSSPSPDRGISPSKESLPRKSSLKKTSDASQVSPIEKPPSNFRISPVELKQFPDHRVVIKDHPDRPNTDIPEKSKPPLERRETYEDRCRKILGMTKDTTISESVVDETKYLKEPKTNVSPPSVSSCRSPVLKDNKNDVSDFITREQENFAKTSTTRQDLISIDKKPKSSRETSPSKRQDVNVKNKTTVRTSENTEIDNVTETVKNTYSIQKFEKNTTDEPKISTKNNTLKLRQRPEKPEVPRPEGPEYSHNSSSKRSSSSPRDSLSPERRPRYESPEKKPVEKYIRQLSPEKTSAIHDFEETSFPTKKHLSSRPSDSPSKPSDDKPTRTTYSPEKNLERKPGSEGQRLPCISSEKKPTKTYPRESSSTKPGYMNTTESVTSKLDTTTEHFKETSTKIVENKHTHRILESPTSKMPKHLNDVLTYNSSSHKRGHEHPSPSHSSSVEEPQDRYIKEPQTKPGYMRTFETATFEDTAKDLEETATQYPENKHSLPSIESPIRKLPKPDNIPTDKDISPLQTSPGRESAQKISREPQIPGYRHTTSSISSKFDTDIENNDEVVSNTITTTHKSSYYSESPTCKPHTSDVTPSSMLHPDQKPGKKHPLGSTPSGVPRSTSPSEYSYPTGKVIERKSSQEVSPTRLSPKTSQEKSSKEPIRQQSEFPGYMKTTESATYKHDVTIEQVEDTFTSRIGSSKYPDIDTHIEKPRSKVSNVSLDRKAECEISNSTVNSSIKKPVDKYPEEFSSTRTHRPEKTSEHKKLTTTVSHKYDDTHTEDVTTIKPDHATYPSSRSSVSPTRATSKPTNSSTEPHFDSSNYKPGHQASPRPSPERKPNDKHSQDSSIKSETDRNVEYTRKTTSIRTKKDLNEETYKTVTSKTTKPKIMEVCKVPKIVDSPNTIYDRTPSPSKLQSTEVKEALESKPGYKQPLPHEEKTNKLSDQHPKESSPTRLSTSPDRKPSYMKSTVSKSSKHETTKITDEINEDRTFVRERYPSPRSSVSPLPRDLYKSPTTKPNNLKESEETRQLRTPSPTKKFSNVSQVNSDFIMSEREQEVLNKVQTSLRKLSPERKGKSPSREKSPKKTTTSLQDLEITAHTIEDDEYTMDDVSEFTNTYKTIKIDATHKPKDEKPKDQKVPSKQTTRNFSPTKKPSGIASPTKIDKGPEYPAKPKSASPRKPLSPIERPQSPKVSGIKAKDPVSSQLTRKPTPATLSTSKLEKTVTDIKKIIGTSTTTKQITLTKISTLKTTTKRVQSPTSKEPEIKRAPTSKGNKDTSKKETDNKVTRTASDISMKSKKISPQRMKSKPEIQISDMSIKTGSGTTKSMTKEPHTKLPSKSATTLNTSADEDDVIIDVEQSKSSRENSPDRICPTPVNLRDDISTPRFPDEVKEPDDEFRKRTHHIIHETESIVDDIVEICEDDELFVKKVYSDSISEDEENLLNRRDKVTFFTKGIDTKPKDSISIFKDTERRVHSDYIEENLKSDECLLSVSEKVNKFAKGSSHTKDNRSPSRNVTEEYDRNTTYQDNYTKLSVHDKAHLFVETAENVKAPKIKLTPQKVERPDLRSVDESLKSDDCLLSVSDKVNKFVKTAEHFMTETQEVEDKDKKIKEEHDKIVKKIVDDVEEEINEDKITISVKDAGMPHKKEPDNSGDKSAFVKDAKSSHGKSKDYGSTNMNPTERVPTAKITLRSSEAVKKAKALFENIATTTHKTIETITKTTKLVDSESGKKSKPDRSTNIIPPLEEDTTFNITDVDSDVEIAPDVTDCSSGKTLLHPHQPRNEKSRSSPSRLTTQSSEVPRAKSPKRNLVENTTKTILLKHPATPRSESPKQLPETDRPEKVPGYLRPTKTSQSKEEPKFEDSEVSSRRGSGKFGVELRRTSVERSTISSERRRSVEHPCIEDIYDVDLLEQMLEKVVGYEQRRRIRAQIRVARKKVDTKHVVDTNTYTRNKHVITQKIKSPERQQTRSPERAPKSHLKALSPDRQSNTPQKSVSEQGHHKEQPFLNGHSKEPSKILTDKHQRAHSPEKLPPKSITKTKSPARHVSPEKKIKTQSPMKASTPKQKTNRFNEYASAYMKKVGLNETDKVKFSEGKNKKVVDDKNKVIKQVEEHISSTVEKHISSTVEDYTTARSYTSSKDVIDVVHRNEKCPETRLSPERKPQSPNRKGHSPERKVHNIDRQALSPERKVHNIDRQALSPERKVHNINRQALSPERKIHSPERKIHSPEHKIQSPERLYQRTPSPEFKRQKVDTGKTHHKEMIIKTVYDVEKKVPQKSVQEEKPSWVTNRNLKKITSETRTFSSKKIEEKPKHRALSPSKVITKPIDIITSSYGPGPLDADGKPLFGIRALRNGGSYQVKGTVIRQEYHSRNGAEPEGTVSVTAYSTEPEDLEKLLQRQGEPPSRIHGLAAITTTKKFGGGTGTTLKEVHGKDERAAIDQFTHSDRRVIDTKIENLTEHTYDTQKMVEDNVSVDSRREETVHDKRDGDKTRVKVEKITEGKEKKMDTKERVERTEEKKSVRQSSVKSLTEKYIKSANESSKADRGTYPKAGLILRTSNMKDSVSSDSSTHAGLARTDSEHSLASVEDTTVTTTSEQCDGGVRTVTTTTRSGHVTKEERSFLDNSTKVTGVQDILTRMKNADIVIQEGDTTEDTEARALLNKFLGATVLMAGMQDYVSEKPSGKVVVKKETVRTTNAGGKVTTSQSRTVEEIDIDQCWDERVLRQLLDECSDYEQRRRLRARIRTLMAEQEACASAVTEALAAAGESADCGDGSEAREEEEVTVTSSVRRNSSEKTVSSSTTTTKTSKVIESMTRAAPKPVSPFAKFRQLEKQNSTNSPKM